MQYPPLEPLVVNGDKSRPGPASEAGFREKLNRVGERVVYAPWKTKKRRVISGSVLGVLVVGGGLTAFMLTRPMARPDYDTDRIDRVFKYTLLTDQFNRMPVDERLALVGQLYQRLKSMDGNESLLLAAFASSVQGKAREQLMENVSQLMVDTADMFAIEYENVPEGQRERYLEDALVRFVELGNTFEGRTSTKPRAEIIAEAKENAARDQERMKENPMSTRQSMRMFGFMNEGMGGEATPQQKGRIGSFMLDMTRHLRGQDINTGKPKRRGGGG